MELLEILQDLMKNKKLKGATLLELIIVIGIISLLLSLILINTNLIQLRGEKMEIRSIEISINNVRNVSIQSRERQSISFEKSSYSTTLNKNLIDLKYLEYLSEKSNISEISFTHNGKPTNTGSGTMYFKGESNTYEISITPATGRIYVRMNNE